jgi:hypothetical protein
MCNTYLGFSTLLEHFVFQLRDIEKIGWCIQKIEKIVKFILEKQISTKKFPFSVKKTTEFVRKKPLTIPLIK